MATFVDETGRTWRVEIDAAAEVRLRRNGINPSGFRNGALFARMAGNAALVGSVLWLLCEPQAQRAGIDPEAFTRRVWPRIDHAADAIIAASAVLLPLPERMSLVRGYRRHLQEMKNGR